MEFVWFQYMDLHYNETNPTNHIKIPSYIQHPHLLIVDLGVKISITVSWSPEITVSSTGTVGLY